MANYKTPEQLDKEITLACRDGMYRAIMVEAETNLVCSISPSPHIAFFKDGGVVQTTSWYS